MHKTLDLSVREQAYVATCFSVDGHANHDERLAKMAEIRDNMKLGLRYSLPLFPNRFVFPDLIRCSAEGILGEPDSVQNYFEGLGHNARLYNQLLRNGNVDMAVEHLQQLLDHTDSCVVRVAWMPHGITRSFPGIMECSVDTDFFGVTSEYVFVHGMNDGRSIAMAEASKHQFGEFSNWFKQHQIRNVEQYKARLQGGFAPRR